MIQKIKKEIECPRCSELSQKSVYTSINITKSPYLLENIMDESIFKFICPKCELSTYLRYPFLYHDMEKGYMLYMVPEFKKKSINDKESYEIYPKLDVLTKRITKNINEFKEKLLIFKNDLDDMTIEVTKLALARTLQKKLDMEIISAYFTLFDIETQKVGFTFFLRGTAEPYLQSISIDLYEKYAEKVSKYEKEINEDEGFLYIDKNWAKEVLKKV